MLRAPSRRSKRNEVKKPNLIPILDAVFIFIFFLLMSANFIKIFEIPSPVPILNPGPPPKNKKKPLALTLQITNSRIVVLGYVPSKVLRSFPKNADNEYALDQLHQYMIQLKKNFKDENDIIFEPLVDLTYEEIVKIMDSVRVLRATDEAIYIKDKDGVEQKTDTLFNNIIFGNVQG